MKRVFFVFLVEGERIKHCDRGEIVAMLAIPGTRGLALEIFVRDVLQVDFGKLIRELIEVFAIVKDRGAD